MSRIHDVQQHIRRAQRLLKKYEEQVRLSSDPKEQERAKKEIADLRHQIRQYQKEYDALSKVALPSPEKPIPFVPPEGASTDAAGARLPPMENAYALVIGIGKYQHIRKLSKTTTDAQDLYDLLQQAGFPPNQCKLLLDEKATKGAISDELDFLAQRVSAESTVVIFFSGHGARRIGGFEPGEYLCPVQADWFRLRETSISNAELTTALRAIPATRLLVCLDACHSGGVGEVRDPNLELVNGLSSASYASLLAGKGRVLMVSCQPNEVSWELAGMRNGLFSHYLLDGLRGHAADPKGLVRVFSLFEYISQHVPTHMEQHPLFKGELDQNWAVLQCISSDVSVKE